MRERRLTGAGVQRIAADLSERDRAIIADVARLRVLTGQQLERLHFAELLGQHRDRARRRVLERLVAVQVLSALERRIGGVRAGSTGLVFALGPAGQRLQALEASLDPGRVRQPGTPTDRFLLHNLAVAELYVRLAETAGAGQLVVDHFAAEPASWWRDSEGAWVKPDALVCITAGGIEDSWAVEVDQATESLPTLRSKLLVYVRLANAGEAGPRGGPLPRVLVTVPHERRLLDVQVLIRSLPEPASQLFAVTPHDRAVPLLTEALRE